MITYLRRVVSLTPFLFCEQYMMKIILNRLLLGLILIGFFMFFAFPALRDNRPLLSPPKSL